MRDEEDIMDYYREFLELANPLQVTQQLSDEDRNARGLLEPRPPPGAIFPRLKPGQGGAQPTGTNAPHAKL